MSKPDVGLTLLDAARIVARGSELDSKLDALASHVVGAAGATAAIVYLFDPVAPLLVPAAQAGLGGSALTQDGVVAGDDSTEIVAHVVRDRRIGTTDDAHRSTAMTATGAPHQIAVPLIAVDESGAEDAEGVLLAGYADGLPDASGADNILVALADLCAVAIRQARLQNALLERADWIGRLANTDALTGLANRHTFERMLELEIARAIRQESQLSILLFDVDGFADTNARLGARAADDVLRQVAATLADQVRLVDTVARYGGDEFALIAPGGGGDVVGRRVRDALALIDVAGEPVSVRVGAVRYPDDGASSDELLKAATDAVEEAKRRGRGYVYAPART